MVLSVCQYQETCRGEYCSSTAEQQVSIIASKNAEQYLPNCLSFGNFTTYLIPIIDADA